MVKLRNRFSFLREERTRAASTTLITDSGPASTLNYFFVYFLAYTLYLHSFISLWENLHYTERHIVLNIALKLNVLSDGILSIS